MKIKPSDVNEFFKLKNDGWTFKELAEKYDVHYTAILYHLKKLDKPYLIYRRGRQTALSTSFRKKLKSGKMYSDYIKNKTN